MLTLAQPTRAKFGITVTSTTALLATPRRMTLRRGAQCFDWFAVMMTFSVFAAFILALLVGPWH